MVGADGLTDCERERAIASGQYDEFLEQLRKHEHLRELYRSKEDLWAQMEELRFESEEILKDFRDVGLFTMGVDLGNYAEMTVADYKPILEVILRHFHRNYSSLTRVSLARAFVAPKATRLVWPLLVRFFREEEDVLVKDALASSMAFLAKSEHLDEVLALYRDPSQGPSRILLSSIVAHSRKPAALQTLYALKDDPDLHIEIAHILKQKARYAAKKAEREAAKIAARSD